MPVQVQVLFPALAGPVTTAQTPLFVPNYHRFGTLPQGANRDNGRMISTMEPIDAYLTVAEAAKLIGVSHSQATRYIRAGQLAHQRIGWQILVPVESARRFKRPERGNPNFRNRHKANDARQADTR